MYKKIVIFSLLIIFTLLAFPHQTSAKDYSLPQVSINATIRENGTVVFSEDRTFSFDGSFSFGYYELPKEGFTVLEEVQVSIDGIPLLLNESREAGTYYVEDTGSTYKIHYFYSAYNERKTFTFNYTIPGLVKVYQDYGEFYWKLQGRGWERPIGSFQARIVYDFSVPISDYFVWAHGPLWGEIKKIDDNTVFVDVSDVPANTFVEARILIPAAFFKTATVINTVIKEKVFKEEEGWAKAANRRRTLARFVTIYVPIISLLLTIALLMYFLHLYNKYGAEFNLPRNFIYVREPPTPEKPAIVAGLMNFNAFNPNSLQATILDLIYRGFIDMEEVEVKGWLGNRKDFRLILKNTEPSEDEPVEDTTNDSSVEVTEEAIIDPGRLDNFEKTLLNNVLFDDKEIVLISELTSKFKRRASYYKRILDNFKEQVQKKVKKQLFYDPKSEKLSIFILVGGVFIGVVSFAGAIFLQNVSVLLIFIPALVYIFGGLFAMPRRSKKGKEKYDLWMGFRSFLRDFSNLKEYGPKTIVLWEKYLVYGTVLGVAREVLKALKVVIPEMKDLNNARILRSAMMAKSFSVSGVSPVNLNQAFNSLNSAMAGLQKVAQSSYSSSLGGGGGFSGGGGGGGGGSGGGVG